MKMTDKEVKKGLKCCTVEAKCNACPYVTDRNCREQMNTDALALINQLEEKNKTLSDKNKELRELCRKKSNEMNIKDWVRMIQEANWGIKVVDKQEEIKLIRKEVLREIYDWMMENAVYYEEESFAKKFAKEHGLEVEV